MKAPEPFDVAFTASVISHNLSEEIMRGRCYMAAHELITHLAIEFETEHCNVEEVGWDYFLEDKETSDWEEYLLNYVKQRIWKEHIK